MQARSTFDWRTLGWLILSAVGGMMGLSAAALLVFLGFFSLTMPTEEANAGMILNLAWAAGLVGLLCLPAGYLALRRLLGRAAPGTVVHSNKTHLVVTIAMITLPLWFGLAALASRSGISWLIMPPLLLVLILLPLAWFLSAGARGLPVSADRAWKLGSFSLAITMPLTLIAELVLLLALLVGWGLWIASQPDLLNQFWNFSTQFQQLTDPMEIQTELVNLLHQPGVIPGVLVILGFITPLLEELLDPPDEASGGDSGVVALAAPVSVEVSGGSSAGGDGSGVGVTVSSGNTRAVGGVGLVCVIAPGGVAGAAFRCTVAALVSSLWHAVSAGINSSTTTPRPAVQRRTEPPLSLRPVAFTWAPSAREQVQRGTVALHPLFRQPNRSNLSPITRLRSDFWVRGPHGHPARTTNLAAPISPTRAVHSPGWCRPHGLGTPLFHLAGRRIASRQRRQGAG